MDGQEQQQQQQLLPVLDGKDVAGHAPAQQAKGATPKDQSSSSKVAAPKDPEVVSFCQGDDVPFDDTTLRGKHTLHTGRGLWQRGLDCLQ